MPRGKRELAERIIPKLREAEVELGRGKTVLEAVEKIGVTEQTYSLGRRSSAGCGRPPWPAPTGSSDWRPLHRRLQTTRRALSGRGDCCVRKC